MSECGYSRGQLSPTVYFEDSSGHLVLPVCETGHPEQMREAYEARFKPLGFEWREARTWPDVTRLQTRLIAQEEANRQRMTQREAENIGPARAAINARLRAQMIRSDCSEWEREFIRLWLELRENRRAEFEQRWREHHAYLWSVEMDAGRKIDDRMPSQPGDKWERSD